MPIVKDDKSLERVAGEVAFQRGMSYYRKGAVKTVARKGNYLEGLVQGSDTDPFHVRILIKGLDNFRLAECTCPFKLGSMCKHAVAVLLHWNHYVAINHTVDLSKMIFLDEKQLRLNAQQKPVVKAVTESSTKSEAKPKPKRPSYLLPAYEYRSPQKPRIQIAFALNGFNGNGLRSIPFKIFIIHSDIKLSVTNLRVLINQNNARDSKQFKFSTLSASQQHVLHLLNEFSVMDGSRDNGFAVPQFKMKRMQWAICLGVMAKCEDLEFVDIKTNQAITVNALDKLILSIHIRQMEQGQWGVTATFKDPNNATRDFSHVHIQEGQPVWLYDEAIPSFQMMHESISHAFLVDFLNNERVLDLPQIPYFMTSVLDSLRSSCEIIGDVDAIQKATFIKPTLKSRLDLNYVKNAVRAKLSFIYDNGTAYAYEGDMSLERYAMVGDDKAMQWVVRDLDEENAKVSFLLKDCGFEWGKNSKTFSLTGSDEILGFVYQKLPMLRRSMEVHCSKDFEAKLLNNNFFEPVVRLTGSGIDWFEFDAVYKVKGLDETITHEKIKRLIAEGQNFIRLKKGEILPIPLEFYERIEQLNEELDTKKIHLSQIPFVMDELKRQGLTSDVDQNLSTLYRDLKNFQSIEPATVPDSVKEVLRDYQHKGVDWLSFLKRFKFGGILADEMGLGKTLQALTMVQLEIEAGNAMPSLVVCPTTLVWNWHEEIKKFLPNARVLILNGNHRRDLFDQIKDAHVVITSYPLLRRDIELYKKFSFNYVILDEAQNIKNRHTQNAQVAKSLKATYRLAMTGTPIENSIMDLWSIFDFLMPGFLGNANNFKKRYEIPITKFQDKDQLTKLSSRILPFVLRRLKKDVIKDLPDKIEQISYCELEPTQAKIYTKMIESARDIATKSVATQGFEKSRMVILTLILRLRQICCHPIIAQVDLGHRNVSGKMELLKETLAELLSGGHKVLIFSQFVSMLNFMEDYLKREDIAYAYLDGSSKDRQGEVERFNQDPNLKVFLLSLKVGGVGLNLTSADTVIIYEPWWNPAVENQAIDRVHRIGQNNSVLAYRLITKGTIEEKMLELQNRKRFLMDSLVLSEDSIGKKLDWEDIKFLLDMK